MSRIHWIIDNGHGGIVGGKYVTAPAKMHTFEDGFKVYEGVFNRSVVAKLAYMLTTEGIPFTLCVPENNDVSLTERKRRTNEININKGGNTVFVSVHGNAGGGTGFEVFTTRGETKADPIATVFFNELQKEFPGKRMRPDVTDGDVDKEANFTVLMCKPPAVLTENLFFDNRADAELMMSDDGQNRIAAAHFEAIKMIDAKFSHISEIK
ncbi:MAG: N-acetylmuramoyl-L-alanine amidase [Deltaproteobacteria bacterium]|nr:N-acetylmuramoyl-L-alanine amidase [Deltaproteobacteria bacterium]